MCKTRNMNHITVIYRSGTGSTPGYGPRWEFFLHLVITPSALTMFTPGLGLYRGMEAMDEMKNKQPLVAQPEVKSTLCRLTATLSAMFFNRRQFHHLTGSCPWGLRNIIMRHFFKVLASHAGKSCQHRHSQVDADLYVDTRD